MFTTRPARARLRGTDSPCEAIAELQKREPAAKLATVEPIPTSEYPTPAKRPMNSRLDCGKLERTFGWRMPEWRESLAAVVALLNPPSPRYDLGDKRFGIIGLQG